MNVERNENETQGRGGAPILFWGLLFLVFLAVAVYFGFQVVMPPEGEYSSSENISLEFRADILEKEEYKSLKTFGKIPITVLPQDKGRKNPFTPY